jgi:2-polyprenyl-6-methoxyphenol hydroxylase-like FAD-dependent oxidoreductase
MNNLKTDNMRRRSTQVIIVGGGPVGLALAVALGQRGIRCALVERNLAISPIPKGQNLTQRTMEHFHFWGVEARLRAARTIPSEYGIGGVTAYGTLLGDYSYDWLQRELVRSYYFTDNERLPQFATEKVLRERAAELATVELLFGWSAEGIHQDDQGIWLDITRAGSSGRDVLCGDYLVGCDGSRSFVREWVGGTQTRSDHDKQMALLVFRSDGLSRLLKRFPGKSYYNVLHPDLKGYWQFFGRVDLEARWFFHAPVPAGATKDTVDFTRLLYAAVGAPFDVAFEHIGLWDLRFAISDTYQCGKIFIAGDAAHSHPPYGGYGINTGFEDGAARNYYPHTPKNAGRSSNPLRVISSRIQFGGTSSSFATSIPTAIAKRSNANGPPGVSVPAKRSAPSSLITQARGLFGVSPVVSAVHLDVTLSTPARAII